MALNINDLNKCVVTIATEPESQIKVTLNDEHNYYVNDQFITLYPSVENKIVITDINGNASISLVENESMDGNSYYIFEFSGKRYKRIVPNLPSIDFDQLEKAE